MVVSTAASRAAWAAARTSSLAAKFANLGSTRWTTVTAESRGRTPTATLAFPTGVYAHMVQRVSLRSMDLSVIPSRMSSPYALMRSRHTWTISPAPRWQQNVMPLGMRTSLLLKPAAKERLGATCAGTAAAGAAAVGTVGAWAAFAGTAGGCLGCTLGGGGLNLAGCCSIGCSPVPLMPCGGNTGSPGSRAGWSGGSAPVVAAPSVGNTTCSPSEGTASGGGGAVSSSTAGSSTGAGASAAAPVCSACSSCSKSMSAVSAGGTAPELPLEAMPIQCTRGLDL